jgi:hypothetical protein
MLNEALANIITLEMKQDSQIDITNHGFSLQEAIKDYQEKSDQDDHFETKQAI